MNAELEDLIKTSDSLCALLDTMKHNESEQQNELMIEIELYSWQVLCMRNDLKRLYKEVNHVSV